RANPVELLEAFFHGQVDIFPSPWFDNVEDCEIYRIADAFGGLLIQESGYGYPVLIDDASRADIGNNQQKALELLRQKI
ncbi:MAG: hypothetical protein R6V60_20505, partial [Desulfobacterales bacterium]